MKLLKNKTSANLNAGAPNYVVWCRNTKVFFGSHGPQYFNSHSEAMAYATSTVLGPNADVCDVYQQNQMIQRVGGKLRAERHLRKSISF